MSHDKDTSQGMLWIWMLTAAGVLTGLLFWLWKTRLQGAKIQPVHIDLSFMRPSAYDPQVPAAPMAQAAQPVVEWTEPEIDLEPSLPDDLTVLIGIGPKIAAVLKTAGIATFADLAQADPEALQRILQAANLRLADPASWPEQARLAAAGKWDEMKAYVAHLKAGRNS